MGSSAQSTLNNMADGLGEWNMGVMQAIQINPGDTTSTCYSNIQTLNAAIKEVVDVTKYPSGTFDFFTLIDEYQKMSMLMIDEFESCGWNTALQQIDGMLSHWDKLGGSVANLGVDFIWQALRDDNINSPLWSAWDIYMVEAFKADPIDWTMAGRGFSQFFTQLVKFENGQEVYGVEPLE